MQDETLTVNGKTVSARSDAAASDLARAIFGPLSADLAFVLDQVFLSEESRLKAYLVRPLITKKERPRGSYYFWQMQRPPAGQFPEDLLVYQVRPPHPGRYARVKLPLGFTDQIKSQGFVTPAGHADRTWLGSSKLMKKLDKNLREKAWRGTFREHGPAAKALKRDNDQYDGYNFPTEIFTRHFDECGPVFSMARLRPFDLSPRTQEHLDAAIQSVIDAADVHSSAFAAQPQEKKQAYKKHLHTFLLQRMIAAEEAAMEVFIQHLNPETVRVLKKAYAFNHRSYEWVESVQDSQRKKKESEPDLHLYRQQFIESHPFFAHMLLGWPHQLNLNDRANSENQLLRLEQLVASGEEILGLDKKGKPGPGLMIFAELLSRADPDRSGILRNHERLDRLLARPDLLRALAKRPPETIGPIQEFLEVMPHLLSLSSAQLPQTPTEWRIAHALIRGRIPLIPEKILAEASGRWNHVQCGLNARHAKAKCEGGIAAEQTLSTALDNTEHYADFIYRSLIVPAAIKATTTGQRRRHPWVNDRTVLDQLMRRFTSHFTLNTLLELSLQYHKTHVQQQYQAIVYQVEKVAVDRSWLPLTENFTIPKGTVYNGIDIGGTTIEWLTTPRELIQEADENKNCVRIFTAECLKNCHILRMKAPDPTSSTGYVRTTVSLYEGRAEKNSRFTVMRGQNMKYGDVAVPTNSASYAAWHWLMDQINNGQEEREKQKARAKSQVPALIEKSTGLPDFASIDFGEVQKRRSILNQRSMRKNYLPYEPEAVGIFDSVLASANQHRLLPRALRGATSAEELLEKMGVKVAADGQLIFLPEKAEAKRPATSRAQPDNGLTPRS